MRKSAGKQLPPGNGNPAGKGVKTMKYQKPEVMSAGRAVEMVQSHIDKGSYQPSDSKELTTNAAYEADE